jgi:hypothetical protein
MTTATVDSRLRRTCGNALDSAHLLHDIGRTAGRFSLTPSTRRMAGRSHRSSSRSASLSPSKPGSRRYMVGLWIASASDAGPSWWSRPAESWSLSVGLSMRMRSPSKCCISVPWSAAPEAEPCMPLASVRPLSGFPIGAAWPSVLPRRVTVQALR